MKIKTGNGTMQNTRSSKDLLQRETAEWIDERQREVLR
jgi:hypothetical protein